MNKLNALLIALMLLSVSFSSAQQYKPIKILPNTFFKGGEKLTLQLRYGFIIGGNVTLELTESNDLLHVKGTAKTTGLADKLFSVKDVYESYFMNSNNLPVFAIQNVKEGKKYTYYNEVKFNHALKKVTSTKSGDHDVPEGIVDMMSVFYMIRRLDLSEAKEGDIYKINTFFSDKLFPFELRYRGKETVETPLGKIRCIKFAPIVEPGRVFKSKDDMFIWFTDDENRLPVLIAMEMLIGSVNCEMIKYENVMKEPVFKK
ncbi:MAG TPA: DUF3108 domain-containing protein [Bacteroidales bacterium]|nr:DUF3108 domain-containing protein [Bacteroidales bacterium]